MEAQDFVSKIHPREKTDRAEIGKKRLMGFKNG